MGTAEPESLINIVWFSLSNLSEQFIISYVDNYEEGIWE